MGHAIAASRRAVEATASNAAFVAVTFVVGLVVAGVAVVLNLIPVVGPLVANVLVVPPFLAGALAMAVAAADGSASIDDFTGGVSEYATSMIGAYGLLYLAIVVVTIGLVAVMVVLGAFTVGLGSVASGSPDAAGALAGLGLTAMAVAFAFVVVAVVVGLAVQFLGAAVVVGGESATSAFGACWRLLARNPVSVVGYTLTLLAVSLGFLAVAGVAYGVGSIAAGDAVALALAGLVALAGYPFLQAFFLAYQAAFYRAAAA